MNAAELVLREVYNSVRRGPIDSGLAGFTWADGSFLRTCLVRYEHGDENAWYDFTQRFERRPVAA